MRGRKPKPIERQIAEGDPRKHGVHKLEEARDAVPQAERGLPPAPEDLGPIARAQYEFWREELTKMDLSYRPDGVMLEAAATHYSRAKQADALIERHGLIVVDVATDVNGKATGRRHVHRNPALAISNQAWVLVRSFCSEFGLSPVGRQRLDVQHDHDDSRSELIALLSQPRTPKTNVQ